MANFWSRAGVKQSVEVVLQGMHDNVKLIDNCRAVGFELAGRLLSTDQLWVSLAANLSLVLLGGIG